jgi:hypothetical protein
MARLPHLPDEVWTLVFVSKRWTVRAEHYSKTSSPDPGRFQRLIRPVFWHDVYFSSSPVIGRAAQAILRSIGSVRDAGIGRWIRSVHATQPFFGAEEMDFLHAILIHTSNLKHLEVNQELPPGVLSSLSLHAPSLHSLSVQLPQANAAVCVALLAALTSLRVLELRFPATASVEWSDIPGLCLPALRTLAWSRDMEGDNSDTEAVVLQARQAAQDAAFLALCRFSLLQEVELVFGGMPADGVSYLRHFFSEHAHVRRADVFMPDDTLIELLPHISPAQLELTYPTNPRLADAISPAVQELVLTSTATLHGVNAFMRALADRCAGGARLALRVVRVKLCTHISEIAYWKTYLLCFRWKDWDYYAGCLGEIVQTAVDLEQAGVMLLDEDLEPLPSSVREDWEVTRRCMPMACLWRRGELQGGCSRRTARNRGMRLQLLSQTFCASHDEYAYEYLRKLSVAPRPRNMQVEISYSFLARGRLRTLLMTGDGGGEFQALLTVRHDLTRAVSCGPCGHHNHPVNSSAIYKR